MQKGGTLNTLTALRSQSGRRKSPERVSVAEASEASEQSEPARHLPKIHPQNQATFLWMEGRAHRDAGRVSEARQLFHEARYIFERLEGKNSEIEEIDDDIARLKEELPRLIEYARHYWKVDRLDAACKCYDEARNLLKVLVGEHQAPGLLIWLHMEAVELEIGRKPRFRQESIDGKALLDFLQPYFVEKPKTDAVGLARGEGRPKPDAAISAAEELNVLLRKTSLTSAEFLQAAIANLALPDMREMAAEGARALIKAVQSGDKQAIADFNARAADKTTVPAKPPGLQPHALPPGVPVPIARSQKHVADMSPEELVAFRARKKREKAESRARKKQNEKLADKRKNVSKPTKSLVSKPTL